MRPWGDPACRVLFPLLVLKLRTDGSSEDSRSKDSSPQAANEGSRGSSKPHWSTLRVCRCDRSSLEEVECWCEACRRRLGTFQYLEVFLHRIQEGYFGSELLELWLESGEHRLAVSTFEVHTQFSQATSDTKHAIFILPWCFKWAPNLCFSSLVESTSGRNFLFSLDSLFQSPAAAAVPVQRKSHRITQRP